MDKRDQSKKDEIILRQLEVIRSMTEHNLSRMGADFWGTPTPEKHVPVAEEKGNMVHVAVGAVAHPMLPEHYIEWIALETNQGSQIKKLQPGQAPEAVFALAEGEKMVAVYAYCNLHGLWKA